jgi:hypothetical protein
MTLVTGASATQDVTANINHYHSGYQRQGRLQRKSSLTGGPRVLGLENLPDNHRFSAGPAAEDELPHLGAMMARHIPGLRASQAAFEEVHRYSQSILSIRGKSGLAGCFAALLLNSEGLARLLHGCLPVAAPPPSLLVRPEEAAAGIYIWALCFPGLAAGAAALIMQWLNQPLYAGADIYARAATARGEAFLVRTGFCPLEDATKSSLWAYRRRSLGALMPELASPADFVQPFEKNPQSADQFH